MFSPNPLGSIHRTQPPPPTCGGCNKKGKWRGEDFISNRQAECSKVGYHGSTGERLACLHMRHVGIRDSGTEAIWVQQNDVVKKNSKVNKSDVSLATSHNNVLFVEHLHCNKCHVKWKPWDGQLRVRQRCNSRFDPPIGSKIFYMRSWRRPGQGLICELAVLSEKFKSFIFHCNSFASWIWPTYDIRVSTLQAQGPPQQLKKPAFVRQGWQH